MDLLVTSDHPLYATFLNSSRVPIYKLNSKASGGITGRTISTLTRLSLTQDSDNLSLTTARTSYSDNTSTFHGGTSINDATSTVYDHEKSRGRDVLAVFEWHVRDGSSMIRYGGKNMTVNTLLPMKGFLGGKRRFLAPNGESYQWDQEKEDLPDQPGVQGRQILILRNVSSSSAKSDPIAIYHPKPRAAYDVPLKDQEPGNLHIAAEGLAFTELILVTFVVTHKIVENFSQAERQFGPGVATLPTINFRAFNGSR